MKAVFLEIPESVIEWRARTGINKFDEIWEGVWHMAPAPSIQHQDFLFELETWLRVHWVKPRRNRVYHCVNVAPRGGWPDKDYRIPDLVLLTPECSAVERNAYIEGAPAAVIEIRSPGDETMEKMPFYAKLGVPEVWVIDRDTRVPTLYVLTENEYEQQQPGRDKWLLSAATEIQVRAARGRRLAIQISGKPETLAMLPED